MGYGLSVVITYYYGHNYIVKCLESIFQSYKESKKLLNFEIIIVIDSPFDQHVVNDELFEKYTNEYDIILYRNQTNIGVSKSRNIGLTFSKFKYFTVIDQDDFVKIDYFSILEEKLDQSFPVHIINASIFYLNDSVENKMFYFSPQFKLTNILFQNTNIVTPGIMIFDKSFIDIKDFFIETSDKYKGCDDWAAYLNILFRNPNISYKYIEDVLFTYCYHDSNYSNNIKEMIFSSISVLDFFSKNIYNKSQLRDIRFARRRYEFLYFYKVRKIGIYRLIKYFPQQFFYQYFFSFFNIDRISRLFYRISTLSKVL